MANNRIYYAVQQVGVQTEGVGSTYTEVHGVQSVSMDTNFNLTQVFEFGQQAIYENNEALPDVQLSITKALDGYPLIYHLATRGALTPTLGGRSNDRSLMALAIFDDTLTSATGTPVAQVATSGMFISTITYNFPLEADFTEEVTVVGNNRVWLNDPNILSAVPSWGTTVFTGAFDNTDSPQGSGGVNRREDLLFTANTGLGTDVNGAVLDPNATILPNNVFGINDNGVNDLTSGTRARLSSISISVDLGREDINELGRRGPYHRFATFPTEVTCSIDVTSTSGDFISATENGILNTSTGGCSNASNLANQTIRVAACEGTRIYLGTKNKLASVSYGGGDAGGGNVTVTYSFSTFNDMTVMHTADPNANFDTSDFATYLTN